MDKKIEEKYPTTRSRKAIDDMKGEFGLINYILFSIGVFILILGFILLKFTDQNASNFASFLSPLMIIISIIIIIISIITDNS